MRHVSTHHPSFCHPANILERLGLHFILNTLQSKNNHQSFFRRAGFIWISSHNLISIPREIATQEQNYTPLTSWVWSWRRNSLDLKNKRHLTSVWTTSYTTKPTWYLWNAYQSSLRHYYATGKAHLVQIHCLYRHTKDWKAQRYLGPMDLRVRGRVKVLFLRSLQRQQWSWLPHQ